MNKKIQNLIIIGIILIVAIFLFIKFKGNPSGERIEKFAEFEGKVPILEEGVSSIDLGGYQGSNSFYADIVGEMINRLQ